MEKILIYLPTIIFIMIIIFKTISGFIKGRRNTLFTLLSTILSIIAVIAFARFVFPSFDDEITKFLTDFITKFSDKISSNNFLSQLLDSYITPFTTSTIVVAKLVFIFLLYFPCKLVFGLILKITKLIFPQKKKGRISGTVLGFINGVLIASALMILLSTISFTLTGGDYAQLEEDSKDLILEIDSKKIDLDKYVPIITKSNTTGALKVLSEKKDSKLPLGPKIVNILIDLKLDEKREFIIKETVTLASLVKQTDSLLEKFDQVKDYEDFKNLLETNPELKDEFFKIVDSLDNAQLDNVINDLYERYVA